MKAAFFGSVVFFYICWLCIKQYAWLSSLWPQSWFLLFCVAVTTVSAFYMGIILLFCAGRMRSERKEAEEHAEYIKRITIMPTKVE